MIDFAQARRAMVDSQVAPSSVTDRRLLAAMRRIPRERFVPEAQRALAYIDRDVPLAGGRVLRSPALFARLLQLAGIGDSDKVLDAGAASGYSTAVLAALAARVVALESDAGLAKTARETLAAEGVAGATVVTGQLQAAAEAPFDVVVVEDIVDAAPPQLLALLGDGGRLVALISANGAPATATLFTKEGHTIAGKASFDALQRANGHQENDAFVF
jgi:protein-L-isoaspartate(D-aspartate) O-methyltransferase